MNNFDYDEEDDPKGSFPDVPFFDKSSNQLSMAVHELCTRGFTIIKTRYMPGSKIYQTKLIFDKGECVYRYVGDYSNEKCESKYHADVVEGIMASHAQYEMVLVIGKNGKNSAVPSLVRREEADTIDRVI